LARELAAEGNDKKAVKALWRVQARSGSDLDEARGLLDLAEILSGRTSGRVKADCELLKDLALVALRKLEARRHDPAANAIAAVRRCKVLGGHGLLPRPGETWDLIFRADDLYLRRCDVSDVVESVPYADITAIEFGGAGEAQSGGGFFGGGFGLAGAAEGMLIASALNLLSTRRTIDTVICLQTEVAELFVHDDRTRADALRIALLCSARCVDSMRLGLNRLPRHLGKTQYAASQSLALCWRKACSLRTSSSR
jgi:hypothetical protein